MFKANTNVNGYNKDKNTSPPKEKWEYLEIINMSNFHIELNDFNL